jgi:hypothetical protein
MIDPTGHEIAAIRSAIKPLSEFIDTEMGWETPLSDYDREEILMLIEVIITAYHHSLIEATVHICHALVRPHQMRQQICFQITRSARSHISLRSSSSSSQKIHWMVSSIRLMASGDGGPRRMGKRLACSCSITVRTNSGKALKYPCTFTGGKRFRV